MYKTAFSARDQHVCHFCTGRTTFLQFSATCSSMYKTAAEISTFCHFCTGRTTFLQFSATCSRMYKTAFSARDQHVLSFLHWAHHFFVIFSNVLEYVQNSVFSPRSARFVIFALGAPLFCDFQQRARVCTKQRFQPEISTFCHFCTGRTTFLQFSATCSRMYKTAFSARDQHVLSFLHWAHHFFAIFSNVLEYVQNSVFSPRSARFVIFALGAPLFCDFQQRARVCTKQRFQPEISTFCHFRSGHTTFWRI